MALSKTSAQALIICILWATCASAAYIACPQFAQPGGSHLANGVNATVTFDYKIDNVAGARFHVTPFHDGSPVAVGLGLIPPVLPAGSGTTSCSFQIASGFHEVDQIRIRMADPASSATLLELFIAIRYTFGEHGFSNIAVSHTPPSWLAHGEDLTVTFDYSSASVAGVRIFARAFTDGTQTPGAVSSGSELLPATGSGSQWFRFAADADITHIRLRMTTPDQSLVLLDHFVPVDLRWRSDGVANIVVTPPSPENLALGTPVTVEFDYFTSDPEGCRVWTRGAVTAEALGFEGEILCPSEVLPAPGGHVTRCFYSNSVTVDLRYVVFDMCDHANFANLFRARVPGDFRLSPNAMGAAAYTPRAPAVLTPNEPVTVDFDYTSAGPDEVRVYAIGSRYDEPATDIIYTASPLLPPGAGHATRQFFLTSAGSVRKVMFTMRTGPDNSTVVEEFTRDAHYMWGTTGLVTGAPLPGLTAARLGAPFPNPFNAHTTIPFSLAREGRVRLRVYDLRGHLVDTLLDRTLPAGAHAAPFIGPRLASGTYCVELRCDGQREVRLMTMIK